MTAAHRYPNGPGYRATGASLNAAVAMRRKSPGQQARVLADVQEHGPTPPSAVSKRTGIILTSARARMRELEMGGKLVKSSRTVPSPHGATEHLYNVPMGEAPAPAKPEPLHRMDPANMTMEQAVAEARTSMDRYHEWLERANAKRGTGESDSICRQKASAHMRRFKACQARMDWLRERDA